MKIFKYRIKEVTIGYTNGSYDKSYKLMRYGKEHWHYINRKGDDPAMHVRSFDDFSMIDRLAWYMNNPVFYRGFEILPSVQWDEHNEDKIVFTAVRCRASSWNDTCCTSDTIEKVKMCIDNSETAITKHERYIK